MSELVLASTSPRRRELLHAAGFRFRVIAPDATEIESADLTAREAALCNALRKGTAGAASLDQGVVLACDTLVALDGEVLGKPIDLAQARQFLRRLSGRTHQVCSAVFISEAATGRRSLFTEMSHVTFRAFGDADIERYITQVNPLDKAGAYAAQAHGAWIIARIDGSRTNVIGLPMEQTTRVLKQFGITPRGVRTR